MSSGINAFTLFHVMLSLLGIFSGLVVVGGLLTAQRLGGWTHLFVWTTVATTLTGFLFPFNGVTPAVATGVVSTIVLIFLLLALYVKKLAGGWYKTYVITAVISAYLNCFVLIAQLFLKMPALNALAPQGKEPPFAISQVIVLLFFVAAGYLSVKRAHQ
jgi:hypothetical protein